VEQALEFVGRYGVAVVFARVFLDQLGVPLPTPPLLLALGALAGAGRLSPTVGLLVATTASVCADVIWYRLGRSRGTRLLGWLCRVALEPDSCVSSTRDLFARYGAKSLLVAKFVPGYDTVAPPLAGLLGVRLVPFVLWSAAGALIWLTAFGGLGYLFSDQLDSLAGVAERLGGTLVLVLIGLVAAWLAWKWAARQRVLHTLRMARITPDELNALILSGQDPFIIDARSRTAVLELPFAIAGALRLTFEELDARQAEIPREREVVIYCS